MSRYFNSACVSPPGAGLGVGEVVGVGFGGSVPGTIVPVIAVALTVPAGVIVAVSEVALGPGDDSVAAPPHAAMAPTNRSAQTRRPLGPAGPPVRCPLPRPPAANVTGRIQVKAEGQDLVVDPAGVEHRFLRLIPSWCAVLQQILLPDDKPDHAVMVRHPSALRGEPIDRNDFEGEADDETVALVLASERNSQAHDIELPGEVLDRAVVGCDPTDTERRDPRFDAQFGHDLDGGAHPARSFHLALKFRERRMHSGSHGVRYEFTTASGSHRRRRYRDARSGTSAPRRERLPRSRGSRRR